MAEMSITLGSRWKNHLGAELVVDEMAYLTYNVLGEIWTARRIDTMFGPTRMLITAEGLESAGYQCISEEPDDEDEK